MDHMAVVNSLTEPEGKAPQMGMMNPLITSQIEVCQTAGEE